jgi:hypothetical protein
MRTCSSLKNINFYMHATYNGGGGGGEWRNSLLISQKEFL